MTIKPLAGYVCVKTVEAENVSKGGIYMPEPQEEKPTRGEVVSIGKSRVSDEGTVFECPVKVKDIVLFKRWGNQDSKVNGETFYFIEFKDLVAILEK